MTPLTFEAFLDRFLGLYRQGEFAQALELIETHIPRFPDCTAQMLAWQSAMLCKLGRTEEALQAIAELLTRGGWVHEMALQHDPDFEAIQSHPHFAALTGQHAERRQAATLGLRPKRQVIAPAGQPPHPLGLVLHGNSSNIPMTTPYWQPLVAEGWALAALQSSQPAWAEGIFVWDDTEKALAEAQTHLTDLLAGGGFNPGRVMAGGFSMGAQIVVRMALDPRFHLHGVIAHEAWFNDEAMAELETLARSAPPTVTRVVLITGQDPEYVRMANQVQALLAGRGMDCRVIHASNPIHAYPPEFDRLLKEAATALC